MPVFYAGFIPTKGGYAVLFPDFPGCCTEGDTLEEAFAMANDALAGHIEVMADDGEDIPAPSSHKQAEKKLESLYQNLDLGELPEGTAVFPVFSPAIDTSIKKVAVSFSKYKLEMIDRKAHAAGMTRSGFLAAAASAFQS